MKKRFCKCFWMVSAGLLLSSGLLAVSPAKVSSLATGQGMDSARAVTMDEVTVLSAGEQSRQAMASARQSLGKKALQGLTAEQVGDAVKFFSGVTVKDYGGLGGMKTISVRSMGAQHTAVAYDGIVLTDCQTGQTDLSRYSIDNVEILSLSIGESSTIFQPARSFASSGVLTIRSQRPVFNNSERLHGAFTFKAGSFGLTDYLLDAGIRLSDRHVLTLSLQKQHSAGDYPFRLYYGDGDKDYNEVNRSNNTVNNQRLEATLFGEYGRGRKLELKTYYYNSDRGLPGAVLLYNTESSQHLWDRTAFTQAHYQQPLGECFDIQLNAKWNQTRQHYNNPDYLGASGEEDYSYRQHEAYGSASILYKAFQGLSLALATDGSVSGMSSNLRDFSEPTRYGLLTSFSGKYVNNWALATASLLSSRYRETTRSGQSARRIGRLSPGLNVSLRPFEQFERLRLRGFYKSSFRVPSFNDLYYSAIGNTALKPENSRQVDAGFSLDALRSSSPYRLLLTGDAFYNRITDKIQAIPTKNMFVWSMVNLGKVDIRGLDVSLEAARRWSLDKELLVVFNHSYQQALDKTDRSSKVYGHQIAYAPRIYGSVRSQLRWTNWLLGYSLLYSGHRYVTGQNLTVNDLKGYSDQSLTLGYSIPKSFGKIVLRGEVQNLTNRNYEIVRNFPMPGRAFRVAFRIEF